MSIKEGRVQLVREAHTLTMQEAASSAYTTPRKWPSSTLGSKVTNCKYNRVQYHLQLGTTLHESSYVNWFVVDKDDRGKRSMARFHVVSMVKFQGRKFGILPLFDRHDTSLEISIQELHPQMTNNKPEMNSYFLDHSMSKKRCSGPQNGSRSLGPEKCQK